MADQPIIVASQSHIAVRMLVVRMRDGRRIESTADMTAALRHLKSKLEAWCQAHHIMLEWSESPGRRSPKREYRIAYHGDNFEADNPNELYDALDAELLRLMRDA